MSAPLITGKSLREKAKRVREEKDEEAKKKAHIDYETILRLCLDLCDHEAGEGKNDCELSTHKKMDKDEAVIKALRARGIMATYYDRKCNSSMCDCEGEIRHCYFLSWPPEIDNSEHSK